MNKLVITLAVFVFITICYYGVNAYIEQQRTLQFIELVTPIIDERDTTSSLRNYKVLTDSLNKICKQFVEDGDGKER